MIIDQLNEIWTGFLEFISRFLIPAWGELINMLPVLLLIGVVGPIVTLLMVFWSATRSSSRGSRRAGSTSVGRPRSTSTASPCSLPASRTRSLSG